jgi:isopenicillin N synthase-like dioxygenase
MMLRILCTLLFIITYVDICDANVPVIDVSVLLSSTSSREDVQTCRDKIHDALTSTKGIFLVTGLGWESAYETKIFDAHKSFWGIPLSSRKLIETNSGGRGMAHVMGDDSEDAKKLGGSEVFIYGIDFPAASNKSTEDSQSFMKVPNIWPAENQVSLAKRFVLESLRENMATLSRVLMGPYLDEHYDDGVYRSIEEISVMRMYHYFPTLQDDDDTETHLGCATHTDWGLVTLIVQDMVGGLEYYEDDEWKPVQCVPGSVVVNGGDWFRLMHPEIYSPLHRVVAPRKDDRYSFVYLFQMSWVILEDHRIDPSRQVDSFMPNRKEL